MDVPTSVGIKLGGDFEKVSLSTRITSASVDLEPPVRGERKVQFVVQVSALEIADRHPGVDVQKIELFDAQGKRMAEVNNPPQLAQPMWDRVMGPQFLVGFDSKNPAAEVNKAYVVVVTTKVGDEDKAYKVRSELTPVRGAF